MKQTCAPWQSTSRLFARPAAGLHDPRTWQMTINMFATPNNTFYPTRLEQGYPKKKLRSSVSVPSQKLASQKCGLRQSPQSTKQKHIRAAKLCQLPWTISISEQNIHQEYISYKSRKHRPPDYRQGSANRAQSSPCRHTPSGSKPHPCWPLFVPERKSKYQSNLLFAVLPLQGNNS